MGEEEKVYNIGIEIGEIIGTYGTDEQIELFERMLEDYKIKNSEYFRLQKENEELKKYKRKHSLIKNHYVSKDKIRDIIEKSYNDIDYFNRDMRKDFEDLLKE